MRRRTGDGWAVLVIGLGTVVSLAWSLPPFVVGGGRLLSLLDREPALRLVVERPADLRADRCLAPFSIDSRPGGFSVAGVYEGAAYWDDRGLAIRISRAAASARYENQNVSGVVFGLAQETGEGRWLVTHKAEPVPLGELAEGATAAVPISGALIPGVTPADLVDGWLVVEHVLDAPDADGGVAWTYAHAGRAVLEPLLDDRCVASPAA